MTDYENWKQGISPHPDRIPASEYEIEDFCPACGNIICSCVEECV